MNTDQLARLAKTVARNVRQAIPRSANRQWSEEQGKSTWLQNQDEIPSHVRLLHTLVRTASSPNPGATVNAMNRKIGGALDMLTKRRKKKVLGITYKTKYDPVTVRDLKRIILEFMNAEGIDLRYQNRDDELRYCRDFGDRLATYLNNRGYRKFVSNANGGNRVLWSGDRVIDNLNSDLLEHQRMGKFNVDMRSFGDTGADLTLPLEYVLGNARNALKFRIGNCEELASVAFAMLLLGKRSQHESIDTGDRAISMELVYIKSPPPERASHFFVVLNRPNFDTSFIEDDKDNWAVDPETIICDPWISDTGIGGPITKNSAEMRELQGWIFQSDICVRATAQLGGHLGMIRAKDERSFYIP